VRLSRRPSPRVFTVLHTARRRAARIKGRCVNNAVGLELDGQRRCRYARQPEVQSKVDLLISAHDGGRGHCAGGTSVKSRETDRENG